MGASENKRRHAASSISRAVIALGMAASMCALPLMTGCSSNGSDDASPQQMEQERKASDQKAIDEANAQRAEAASSPAAQNDASEASAWLDQLFGSMRGDGGSTARDMLSAVWFDPADFGISWAAFSDVYYDGAGWTIGDALGDGQGAVTVEATVHVRQMAPGIKIMRGALDAVAVDGAAQEGAADEALREAASVADWPFDDIRVQVELQRGDGDGWTILNKEVVAAALLDGYDPRQAS